MKAVFLAILAGVCQVVGQDNRPPDPNNHFIFPPLPGPQWSNDPSVFSTNINITVGSPQNQPFKWVSNMTSMKIYLQQEGNELSVQQRQLTACSPGHENFLYWDGNIGDIDLKNGSQAYLSAYNCSEPGSTPIFFSHYINLTEPVIHIPTSSSSLVASATSSSSTQSKSTTPTSSPSSISHDSSSSSVNGAAIGGGVGGGIGGAAVIIAIGFFIWRSQKRKQQAANANAAAPAWAQSPDQGSPPPAWAPHEYYKPPPTPAEADSIPTMQLDSYTPMLHISELGSAQDMRAYNDTVSELPSETGHRS